ncbi:MAG TPA: prolyl oligopeptidase family serine peptidase [Sphingobium sp.]|nr:prolyl oligopeptidase family serine peptidase [Sphingobium sp.]
MMKFLLLAASAIAGPAIAQDKFQWLEAPTDAKALEWARSQTREAAGKIAAMPDHAEIRAELTTALAAGDPAPHFLLAGPYALRFQRSVSHPHGVLAVAQRRKDGTPGAWRDLLDVDALNRTSGKAYELRFDSLGLVCEPVRSNRCLLQLSPSGGDEAELREFDLDTGQFVQGGFTIPASRTSAAWLDADHLLVAHTANGAPTLPSGWARTVSIWTRGTSLSAAKAVYSAQPTDAIMLVSATGEGARRVGVIQRAIDYSTLEFLVVSPARTVERAPFPTTLKMGMPLLGGGRIYAQLGQDETVQGEALAAETVLAYDTDPSLRADKRLTSAYRPDGQEYVTDAFTGMAATRNGLKLLVGKRGVQQILSIMPSADGWTTHREPAEPVGTAVTFGAVDPVSDDIVISRAGYLVPNSFVLQSRGKSFTLFSEKPAFDASKFQVELKSATSGDGTEIDYYLLCPKLSKGATTPLLMTGYGAFGISMAPGYLDRTVGGKSLLLWLNRGGALAVPLIRGGGERGEAWHQAAIREKRENSYDDFAAVTEALIKSGFTTPRQIGVFGMSNGGLLAAVMGTRHPDLYGAIVSDVPLTDLVRMPFMGMGAAWVNEYGDANKPDMLATINRYSPYQTVSATREYPPFMITVATSDNRVGPGHARKLAAKLESVGATVYYLEDEEGGHGVSDPLSRPDLMANRMSFLINRLMPQEQ